MPKLVGRRFHAVLLTVCVLAIAVNLFLHWRSDIRRYDRVILYASRENEDSCARTLSRDEQAELASIVGSLHTRRSRVLSVPDMYFLAYKEGVPKPDEYAVFFEEGLVYKGFFLDAWSERMHDRRSRCLMLNKKARCFLEQLGRGRDEGNTPTLREEAKEKSVIPD